MKSRKTVYRAWFGLVFAAASLLGLGASHPAEDSRQVPPALKRLVAYRKELPAAFTKQAPLSVADLAAIQAHVEALIRRVSPAIVAVEVGSGSGSGVIVSPDGLVLTAGHVCGRPGRDVRFTFSDGKTLRGKTLGVDRDSDTGLMRMTGSGPWPYVPVGDLDQAELGDWVLAVGHPGGFDAKRSLVTRLGRILRMSADALQTDCTIAPGDSGGPLLDMHGRVIGIHSAISSSLAENFHVSISEFYNTWDELAGGQKWNTSAERPRAYLGATAVDNDAGCKLETVDEKSPAARAGLRPGDLLLRVDQREVKTAAALRRWVAEAEPGETLSLEFQRAGKKMSANVKLQAPPIGRQ